MVDKNLSEQFGEDFLPVAGDDNVVVADRVGEEVLCGFLVVEPDLLLGAAKVALAEVFH